jgi:hypothetical protein
MSDGLAVFLHVPKTAGTTLREIVNRQFRPDLVYAVYETDPAFPSLEDLEQLPSERLDSLRVVLGHMNFAVVDHIPETARFMTILREPVDRVLSLYHHQMTLYRKPHQRLPIPDHVVGRKMILCDNHQTRIVSGESPKFGKCHEGMLERAIENIESRFDVVGLTERFDESLLLMCEAFDWVIPFYIQDNVSVARPERDEFSESDLNVIREYNDLDARLYDYAARRLDSEVADRGDRFQDELRAFRGKNNAYAVLLKPTVAWKT